MTGAVILSCVLLAAVAAADDPVVTTFATKERPDTATLFAANATIGNARANWRFGIYDKRAHGDRGRTFRFSLGNGKTFGYSGLVNVVKLTVNGIPWDKLQVKPKNVREWREGDRSGVEFVLNFDGAPVRVRTSMTPGSPTLDFEVKPSARGLTPVTNLLVGVSAIPSFLDCGHGRRTRFDGYRRTVRTKSRTLPPQKSGSVAMRSDDAWYVLMDADYDGSAEGKGNGPCAVRPAGPTPGRIELNDGWVTTLWFAPDPSKPFRFSLLEYPDTRLSNAAFAERSDIPRVIRNSR